MKAKLQPLRVHVTAKDIREGMCCDAEHCPVARAVRRAIGKDRYISVVSSGVTVGDEDNLISYTRYLTPPRARKFIRKFDADEDRAALMPFSFTLAPGKANRFGDTQ